MKLRKFCDLLVTDIQLETTKSEGMNSDHNFHSVPAESSPFPLFKAC